MSFVRQYRMNNGQSVFAVHLLIDLLMKRDKISLFSWLHLTIRNSMLQTSFSVFKLFIVISWFCIVAWESVSIAFMSASRLLSSTFSAFSSRSVSSQPIWWKNKLKYSRCSGGKPLSSNQDYSALDKNINHPKEHVWGSWPIIPLGPE